MYRGKAVNAFFASGGAGINISSDISAFPDGRISLWDKIFRYIADKAHPSCGQALVHMSVWRHFPESVSDLRLLWKCSHEPASVPWHYQGQCEEAQQKIVNIIRKLEDSAEIVIARGGGDEIIV